MSDRYKLNETRSPIDPSSWRELNQNWELIQSYLRFLERQIKFLAGGKEIDEILIRIDTAIENAENATEDAEAAKREVDNALQQLEALVTSTQNAANNANTAARDANTLNTALTALKRELETLQTNLNSIVQSEAQRVSAENIRRENEAARSLKEQARESAEQQRNTTFDSKITEADQKTASMQDLIRNLVSYSYAPGTTYVFPNLVKWNGSTFIALRRVTGITPVDDGVNYRLVAEKGAKGDTGAGINVLGRFDDTSGLPATGSIGDAYIIGINLYVWGGTNWVDGGPIQGPKGDTATSTTFLDFVINASDTTQVALSSGVTINPTGYSYNADTDTFEVYRNSRILYPGSDYTIENGSIRVSQSVTEPDKTTFYIRVTRVVYRIDEDAGRETIVNALGYTPANDTNLAEVEQRLAKQLAQKALKDEVIIKGNGTLNDFNEPTRAILQGLQPGQINAVLGIGNVQKENLAFTPIVGVPSKNLFDKDSAFLNKNISTITGDLTDFQGVFTSDFILVSANTQYTLTRNTSYSFMVVFFDSTRTFIGSQNSTATFTTPDGTAYLRFRTQIATIDTAQVEKGAVSTPYEPYNIYLKTGSIKSNSIDPKALKSGITPDKTTFFTGGKNLFNKETVTPGHFVLAATGNLSANSSYVASDYIPVEPNTTYARSYVNQIAFYDGGKNYISGIQTADGGETFTTPSNAYFVRVTVWASFANTFQLEKGYRATSYEPYGLKIANQFLPSQSETKKNLATPSEIMREYLISGQPFKVKLIGDSITYGAGGTGRTDTIGPKIPGTDFPTNPTGHSWANSLRDLLQSKYNATVVNYGISGMNSAQLPSRIGFLLEPDDDVVFMQLGTNDRSNLASPTVMKQYQRDVIERAHVQGTKVILMSACPATVSGDNEVIRKFGMYDVDKAIRELAYEFDMTHISNYDAFLQYAEFRNINMDTLLADGLHPNDEGYDVMFRNIVRNLGISYVRTGITK